MKNAIQKILTACLLIIATSSCASASAWSAKKAGTSNYKIGGDEFDSRSITSHGISVAPSARGITPGSGKKAAGSIDPIEEEVNELTTDFDDSVSTMDYDQPSTTLFDDETVSPYIKRLYLEVTPANYEQLHGLAAAFMTRGMFNRFDKGVAIKWPGSRSFDEGKVSALLKSLRSATKLRVSIEGGARREESLEFIWDSLQGLRSIQEIDVSGCGMSNAGVTYIMDSVGSPHVTSLDLRGNRITADMEPVIRERFKKLKDLKTDTVVEAPKARKSGTSEEKRLREEQLQKQLVEAEKKAAETEKNRQKELEAERQKRLAAEEESKKAKKEVERLEEQRQKELRESEARESAVAVARPLKSGPAIPDIARGYEEIYLRFLGGKLVYQPDPIEEKGFFTTKKIIQKPIELMIRDIMNPNTLEGVFDLSRCGDTGKYLSINTGYRKGKKAANKDKVEIWFAPRFLIEKELGTTAGHFREIMTDAKWPKTAGIGLFYTWGNWDDLGWYDYLTTNNPDQLGDTNLYEKWRSSQTPSPLQCLIHITFAHNDFMLFLN